MNKASLPHRPPPPFPHPQPLSSSPQHTPRPRSGSLNISLPEVAVVGQFVGLAGGALGHVLGDSQGHRLHLCPQGAGGLRALRAPGADLVRQAGDLGTQLGGGSPQRPEQPPLAEVAGRLPTTGDRRLRLGRAGGAGGRRRGEGQRGPRRRGVAARSKVGPRAAGRAPPVVAVDAPEGTAAPATPALAAQQAEEGALELAAGARVDERVHAAVEVAEPEDDLEDALRGLQLREQGACGEAETQAR